MLAFQAQGFALPRMPAPLLAAPHHVQARSAPPRRIHLNLENRFTGWTDVPLTATGVSQAQAAGRLLKAEGYDFDVGPTPRC